MNDEELITVVREQRAKVHSATPVEQIISRGRAVRTRRRIPGVAGALAVVAGPAPSSRPGRSSSRLTATSTSPSDSSAIRPGCKRGCARMVSRPASPSPASRTRPASRTFPRSPGRGSWERLCLSALEGAPSRSFIRRPCPAAPGSSSPASGARAPSQISAWTWCRPARGAPAANPPADHRDCDHMAEGPRNRRAALRPCLRPSPGLRPIPRSRQRWGDPPGADGPHGPRQPTGRDGLPPRQRRTPAPDRGPLSELATEELKRGSRRQGSARRSGTQRARNRKQAS
jgi:hypothetical protein